MSRCVLNAFTVLRADARCKQQPALSDRIENATSVCESNTTTGAGHRRLRHDCGDGLSDATEHKRQRTNEQPTLFRRHSPRPPPHDPALTEVQRAGEGEREVWLAGEPSATFGMEWPSLVASDSSPRSASDFVRPTSCTRMPKSNAEPIPQHTPGIYNAQSKTARGLPIFFENLIFFCTNQNRTALYLWRVERLPRLV